MAVAPNQVAASPVLFLVTNPLTAEFMIGALIALLWLSRRRMPAAPIAAVLGLAALAFSIGYLAPATALFTSPHINTMRVLMFGIPSALASDLRSSRRRATEPVAENPYIASLVALGDWSYATYLLHVLVISAVGLINFVGRGADTNPTWSPRSKTRRTASDQAEGYGEAIPAPHRSHL